MFVLFETSAKVAVVEGIDVSETHQERSQIGELAKDYTQAVVNGDSQKLSKLTSSEFFEQTSLKKGEATTIIRDLQIVSDGFGLLIRFDYRKNNEKDWYTLPAGSWYRLKKINSKWIINSLVNDYIP